MSEEAEQAANEPREERGTENNKEVRMEERARETARCHMDIDDDDHDDEEVDIDDDDHDDEEEEEAAEAEREVTQREDDLAIMDEEDWKAEVKQDKEERRGEDNDVELLSVCPPARGSSSLPASPSSSSSSILLPSHHRHHHC